MYTYVYMSLHGSQIEAMIFFQNRVKIRRAVGINFFSSVAKQNKEIF